MVVPTDEGSFEYDPEEELDIEEEDDGDSDEIDEDCVPEGGSGGLGESDGEGMRTIQMGRVKFRKREWM